MKPNLLVICCGKDALHQKWGYYSQYNFDVFLLIYDDADYSSEVIAKAKWVIKDKGYKFPLMKRYITPEIYSQYEFIGNIDDDIETTPETIDNIFKMAKYHNFDLCQPTLTHDSYRSHPQTLKHDGYDFRITNTVEIMCPFFSRQAFANCVFDFDTAPHSMGYGLEYSWQWVLESYKGRTELGGWVAFIDKYPVKHTKPVTKRLEISEPDIWHYRKKYDIDHLWVFDDNIIKGFKSNV